MSDIIQGVNTYLRTKAAVTSLVANDSNGSDHIHPEKLPQTVSYPAIRLSVITGESVEHLTGAEGTAQTRIEIDCIATTHIAAEALREAVRGVMQGYSGSMGSVTVRDVSGARYTDFYEAPNDGSDAGWYRRILELVVTYDEAVPSL